MIRSTIHLLSLLVLVAVLSCGHTDAYPVPAGETNGPPTMGTPGQLTFNTEQDYWPAWTQDGKGILYAYVDYIDVLHRCVGLLPAAGGTRIWSMCDDRTTEPDTTSEFGAFALDSTGRLLYTESTTLASDNLLPAAHVTLWLADTAHPFIRTALLTLPVTAGATPMTWLADIKWTGTTSFVALGQVFTTVPHCVMGTLPDGESATQCLTRDTTFVDTNGVVVRGTIAGNSATLEPIEGTEGATGYSFANDGATVVFTLKGRAQLFTVPISGGAPPAPGSKDSLEVAGVSCKGTVCVDAVDRILLTLAPTNLPCCQIFAHFWDSTMQVHRISLTTGSDEVIDSVHNWTVFATPQISPVTGDVVIQVGGTWGHLQTFATAPTGDLFALGPRSQLVLLRNVVP